MTENYQAIISGHTSFTAFSQEVTLRPTNLSIGFLQFGRLSRAVTVALEVDGLEEYRRKLGLGPMSFSPHLSVFSQEIRPLSSIKDMSISDFSNLTRGANLSELEKMLGLGSKQSLNS